MKAICKNSGILLILVAFVMTILAPTAASAIGKQKIFELSNQVETRGGGPLFGVNGVSVVGHGAARAEAVKRAIGMAKLAVDTGFVSQMYQDLESVHARLEEQ